MRYTLLFVFLLASFFSCQTNLPNPEITDRVIFKESPLDSVYSILRPEIQEFTINTNQPNKVVAKKGTEIFIPENCFVDEFGKSVLGKVEVTVTEVFELEDFITSGLATMSDGQLLISNGMMNIDAMSDGKRIGIKAGKEISISMPTQKDNTDFQMFVGDGQNWTIDSDEIGKDYLIPLPLELLYPYGDRIFYYLESPGYLDSLLKSNGISIKDKKNENTIIATEEFYHRTNVLFWMADRMSILKNKNLYLGQGDFSDWYIDFDIVKMYFDNPNESIEILDELAKQIYVQFYDDNEKELNVYFKKYNEFYKTLSSSWGERPELNKERFMSILDEFPKGDKGKVKIIDNYDVDLNSENAANELKQKGIASKEIDDILSYHFKRKKIIEKLEKRIKVRAEGHAFQEFTSTIFTAKKLGWINCDRFYNDPNAKESNIMVSNSSSNNLETIEFSLVLPNLNARIIGMKNNIGKYSFTGNRKPYTKLPVGEKAIVIGTSIQDGSIFFASKEIEIQEELSLTVDLKPVTKEELKESFANLF